MLSRVVQRGGQGLVGGPALAGRCGVVDRRTDEWMAELEPRAVDLEQPRAFSYVELALVDPELGRCRQHEPELLRIVCSRDEEQALRVLGKPANALEEDLLDPARQRQRLGERLGAGELRRRERRGHLEQRERVAVRLLDQPVDHGDIDVQAGSAFEQRRRRLGVERADEERGDAGRFETAHVSFSRSEDHEDPLGLEAPCHEQQRVGRGVVEPVRIVDEAQDRTPLRQLREQGQARRRDEEALGALGLGEAEGTAKGLRLWLRDPLDVPQGRVDELMERREGQLGLGLHAARRQHVHVVRALPRVLEQGGLPDARLSAHDQGTALRPASRSDQLPDSGALGVAPTEHASIVRRAAPRVQDGARGRRSGRSAHAAGGEGWRLAVEREVCELRARRDAQLREHVAQVVVDRPRREEELRRHLLVRSPFGDEPRDLDLLGRELVEGARVPLPRGLAGRAELRRGPLGPRGGVHALERINGRAKVDSGIRAAAFAAEMLAVEEVDAREIERQRVLGELERVLVLRRRRIALAHERAAAVQPRPRPGCLGLRHPGREGLERLPRLRAVARAGGSFDLVRHRLDRQGVCE
jgi:hypothetical protein